MDAGDVLVVAQVEISPPDLSIVSATKGIENDSLEFIDEILASELPDPAIPNLSYLSGPSFAKELAAPA